MGESSSRQQTIHRPLGGRRRWAGIHTWCSPYRRKADSTQLSGTPPSTPPLCPLKPPLCVPAVGRALRGQSSLRDRAWACLLAPPGSSSRTLPTPFLWPCRGWQLVCSARTQPIPHPCSSRATPCTSMEEGRVSRMGASCHNRRVAGAPSASEARAHCQSGAVLWP